MKIYTTIIIKKNSSHLVTKSIWRKNIGSHDIFLKSNQTKIKNKDWSQINNSIKGIRIQEIALDHYVIRGTLLLC